MHLGDAEVEQPDLKTGEYSMKMAREAGKISQRFAGAGKSYTTEERQRWDERGALTLNLWYIHGVTSLDGTGVSGLDELGDEGCSGSLSGRVRAPIELFLPRELSLVWFGKLPSESCRESRYSSPKNPCRRLRNLPPVLAFEP